MINNILLISEDKIKTESGISDNVWGKSLLPAIREAQQIGLYSILGDCLYNSICSMVDDGSITDIENAAYKALLDDYISYYLLYKTIADLIPIIGVKIANIGTVISNDEHVVNLNEDERNRVVTYYTYRSDYYCKRLQRFLLENKEAYEELDECQCSQLKANLDSAASTSLWLGGLRSRKLF